ncbi:MULTISPECIES: hypothetical protein [unclassified Moraxella]|uniref:hypothetical protein n=1 Tax=unclassified Moraxella TaxID=2685852 RepID=UPI003AF482BE
MSQFDEDLAEKYGLTGEKLQQFHQSLDKLYEDYKGKGGDYYYLYESFLNVLTEFGIERDNIDSLVKDLYNSSEHRRLITEFSMSVTVCGDLFQDKFFDTCERIMRFQYDDSEDRDDEAETPWDLN